MSRPAAYVDRAACRPGALCMRPSTVSWPACNARCWDSLLAATLAASRLSISKLEQQHETLSCGQMLRTWPLTWPATFGRGFLLQSSRLEEPHRCLLPIACLTCVSFLMDRVGQEWFQPSTLAVVLPQMRPPFHASAVGTMQPTSGRARMTELRHSGSWLVAASVPCSVRRRQGPVQIWRGVQQRPESSR